MAITTYTTTRDYECAKMLYEKAQALYDLVKNNSALMPKQFRDTFKSDFKFAFYDCNDKSQRVCEIIRYIHDTIPIKRLSNDHKTHENLYHIYDKKAKMLNELKLIHGSLDPYTILYNPVSKNVRFLPAHTMDMQEKKKLKRPNDYLSRQMH